MRLVLMAAGSVALAVASAVGVVFVVLLLTGQFAFARPLDHLHELNLACVSGGGIRLVPEPTGTTDAILYEGRAYSCLQP
jgi:hypothetical protein